MDCVFVYVVLRVFLPLFIYDGLSLCFASFLSLCCMLFFMSLFHYLCVSVFCCVFIHVFYRLSFSLDFVLCLFLCFDLWAWRPDGINSPGPRGPRCSVVCDS